MAKIFILLAAIFLSLGCSKPNPQPWVSDPAFVTIQQQLADLDSQLTSHHHEIAETKKALKNAVVQTGQARTARAKLDKQLNAVQKLEQRKRQLQLALRTRAKDAQTEYMTAFRSGLEQAPKDLSDQLSLQLSLSKRSRNWRVEKRIEEEKSRLAGNSTKTSTEAH